MDVVSVTRPELATLQDAIKRLNEGFDVHTPEQILQAGLIVVGEACTQLHNESKSSAEVVASLGEHGLPPERAQPWVAKAEEVVKSDINKDPGRYLRAHSGWNIPAGAIGLCIVAGVAIYFMWPW